VTTGEPRPCCPSGLSRFRRASRGHRQRHTTYHRFCRAKDEHLPPTCPVNVVSPEPRLSPRPGLTLLRPRKSPARAGLSMISKGKCGIVFPHVLNFQTFRQCPAAATAGVASSGDGCASQPVRFAFVPRARARTQTPARMYLAARPISQITGGRPMLNEAYKTASAIAAFDAIQVAFATLVKKGILSKAEAAASVRARMQTPSCTSYQLGSLTTTRFTRTRPSDIVHPVSSSQLSEARDRVRSFGGYNRSPQHDLLASFVHLCRNCSFVCGDSGMDRASLDPKALSGQKPERSALHRCRYRVGCECGTRRFGRFANRGGAWLYRVRDRPNFSHE
jgi:hypothetical protein